MRCQAPNCDRAICDCAVITLPGGTKICPQCFGGILAKVAGVSMAGIEYRLTNDPFSPNTDEKVPQKPGYRADTQA